MADWNAEADGTLAHNQGYIRHLLEGSTSTLELLRKLTAQARATRPWPPSLPWPPSPLGRPLL
eukprot:7126122-Prymnesium_polylepis.1